MQPDDRDGGQCEHDQAADQNRQALAALPARSGRLPARRVVEQLVGEPRLAESRRAEARAARPLIRCRAPALRARCRAPALITHGRLVPGGTATALVTRCGATALDTHRRLIAGRRRAASAL